MVVMNMINAHDDDVLVIHHPNYDADGDHDDGVSFQPLPCISCLLYTSDAADE